MFVYRHRLFWGTGGRVAKKNRKTITRYMEERVARFADTQTRRNMGFDIDTCIKLKIPPNKVVLAIKEVPFTIGKSDVLPQDKTRWISSKVGGLHVCRRADGVKDSYSIDDIRYTHSFNYITGQVRIYHKSSNSFEEWVHSSSNSLSASVSES